MVAKTLMIKEKKKKSESDRNQFWTQPRFQKSDILT